MPLHGEAKRKYQRNWSRKYRIDNRDKVNKNRRNYRKRIRLEAIAILGGKCFNCGCDDENILEVNHIHGANGEKSSDQLYNRIRRGETEEFNVACRICQWYHYLRELKGYKGNWTIVWRGIEENASPLCRS